MVAIIKTERKHSSFTILFQDSYQTSAATNTGRAALRDSDLFDYATQERPQQHDSQRTQYLDSGYMLNQPKPYYLSPQQQLQTQQKIQPQQQQQQQHKTYAHQHLVGAGYLDEAGSYHQQQQQLKNHQNPLQITKQGGVQGTVHTKYE